MKDECIKHFIILALKFWNMNDEKSAKIVVEFLINQMVLDEAMRFFK